MQLKRKPRPGSTVPRTACTNTAMAAGNEGKVLRIIDAGDVKCWVGIGWVTEGRAEPEDYRRYPVLAQE